METILSIFIIFLIIACIASIIVNLYDTLNEIKLYLKHLKEGDKK